MFKAQAGVQQGGRLAAECCSVLPGAAGTDFPVVAASLQHVPPRPPLRCGRPHTVHTPRLYPPCWPKGCKHTAEATCAALLQGRCEQCESLEFKTLQHTTGGSAHNSSDQNYHLIILMGFWLFFSTAEGSFQVFPFLRMPYTFEPHLFASWGRSCLFLSLLSRLRLLWVNRSSLPARQEHVIPLQPLESQMLASQCRAAPSLWRRGRFCPDMRQQERGLKQW